MFYWRGGEHYSMPWNSSEFEVYSKASNCICWIVTLQLISISIIVEWKNGVTWLSHKNLSFSRSILRNGEDGRTNYMRAGIRFVKTVLNPQGNETSAIFLRFRNGAYGTINWFFIWRHKRMDMPQNDFRILRTDTSHGFHLMNQFSYHFSLSISMYIDAVQARYYFPTHEKKSRSTTW